jgi:hypothetical protein
MFKTKNNLPEATRVKAIELLNARLADCKDLQSTVTLVYAAQVDAARTLIAERGPFRPESVKGRLPA